MAKQKAFLHVGLPHSGGDLLDAALREHASTAHGLVDGRGRRVRLPARSEMEMFNAAVEMRRDHRAWGLRRKDVEGSWARLCRRAIKNKDTVVFSHHLLAGCPPDGIALMVDQLPGCEVHVVVTVGTPDPRAAMFPEDYDLTSVVERWSAAVQKPDRLHLHPGETPTARTTPGTRFGDVLGFDARGLALPRGPVAATDQRSLRPVSALRASARRHDESGDRGTSKRSAASLASGGERASRSALGGRATTAQPCERSERRHGPEAERSRGHERSERRHGPGAEARAGKQSVGLPGVLVGGA